MNDNPITEINEFLYHQRVKLEREECISGIQSCIAKRLYQIQSKNAIYFRERREVATLTAINKLLSTIAEEAKWDEDEMNSSLETVLGMLIADPLTQHWPAKT